MGLGVKVATLPVLALGVGIGVDYGIYLYSRMEGFLHQGMTFRQAYFEALKTTGTSVAFTGITLALGVATWAFSALKFQADMGLLLVLLFIWNMVGALVLLPAIASLLRVGERRRLPETPQAQCLD
jgi:predicted RND superfamily exporter protein